MRTEHLIAMANEIAAFFRSTEGVEQGAENVANHLRRYWDPRMRKQIVQILREGGEGLTPLARAAVERLAG